MRFPRSATSGVLAALLFGACAGPRTEIAATASPTANFQALKTYAFVPADHLDLRGSQMGDPVARRNLEAAIGRELQARGLLPAASDAKPALLVSYFADVDQGAEYQGAQGRAGERQGEIAIDVIDVADQQVVWHGEARARDPNPRIAEQLVTDLLRKYPQVR